MKRRLSIAPGRHRSWLRLLPVLLLILLAFLLDLHTGWPIPGLRSAYVSWDPVQMGNILGVLAQVIGLMMTILVTGIFVAVQFLGDRVPPSVLQRFIWGRSSTFPVYNLGLLLLYDIALFCLTGRNLNGGPFVPVVGLVLLLVTILLSWRGFLAGLTGSVRALNVHRIIAELGETAVRAEATGDSALLRESLTDLYQAALFATRHGQSDTARLAFQTFAHTAMAPGIKVEPDSFLLTAPHELLEAAMQSRDTTLFGVTLQRMAVSLTELPPPLREAMSEEFWALTKHRTISADPVFGNELLAAATQLTDSAMKSRDGALFNLGLGVIRTIWLTCAFDEPSRHAVLRSLSSLCRHAIKATLPIKLRRPLTSLYLDCGFGLIRTGNEAVYEAWLTGFSAIARTAGNEKQLALLEELVLGLKGLYESGFSHHFDLLLRTLPTALLDILRKLPAADGLKLAAAFDEPVTLALRSGDELALGTLAEFLWWLYETGNSSGEWEQAEKALRMASRYPLSASDATNRITALFDRAVEAALQDETERAGGAQLQALLHALLEWVKLNSRSIDPEALDDVVRIVDRLLQSGSLTSRSQSEFIGFCCRSDLDNGVRRLLFQKLNLFIREVRDWDVLQDAQKEYRALGIRAIEERDEPLVQLIFTYLGWLSYGMITARRKTADKVELAGQVLQTCLILNRHARHCGLSRSTLVFLSSPFVLVGAVCELLEGHERKELLQLVLDATVQLDDPECLEAGLFGRMYYFQPDELRRQGEAPYRKFMAHALEAAAKREAAATSETADDAT
ncbi:MAG: hypothetical protein ACM3XM_07775 [Mycobacterium leprae]